MKTLATAVLGLGRVAWQFHLPQIREHHGYKLVGVVDPLEDRRREAVSEYRCAAYASLDELLKSKAEPLDLIVIASPTPFHTDQALAAFEQGIDVLCDKPMASTLAEADRMIDAMHRTGRKLMVFQPRRCDAVMQALRAILARGVLGRVYLIRHAIAAYRRRNDWQAFSRNGGGMLNNYGAHAIDQLLYLTGSTAANLSCRLRTVSSLGDADDVVKAVIETRSGVILDIDINMAAAWPLPEWFVGGAFGSAVFDKAQAAWRLRYFDPSELAEVRPQEGLAAAGRSYENGETIPWREELVPLAGYETLDFYEKCYAYYASGEAPFVPIQESREVMRVLAECRKSAMANA